MNTYLQLILYSGILLITLFISNGAYAVENLVKNGDFEFSTEHWNTNNSNIVFNIVNDPVFDGIQSASISNSSSSSFGIEHIVTGIQENTDYLINGRIKIIDPPPSKAFIRIAWYESSDGSGSQIKTEDSELISAVTDWKILSFVAKTPSLAHSAKIRLLVSSGTAYFDNITIELNNPITNAPSISPTSNDQVPTLFPTPTEEMLNPSPNNIYISEIMVYPDTGQTEWIELYNDNDFEVSLTDWYIDDIDNAGSSPKKFTMTIDAKSYGVLDISTAMFNNDSDSARILDSEEIVKDSISYTSSQKNYSIGKINLAISSVCFQQQSKNSSNSNCINIIPTAAIAAVSPTKKSVEPTVKKTPSVTPGSRKLLPTLQAKPLFSLAATSDSMKKSETENILGAATAIVLDQPDTRSLLHTLTILAFSYSILSIIAIITKITFQKVIPAP